MILFRKLSFYLALIGILLTVFLVWKLGTPPPEAHSYVPPAANPYENAVAASGLVEAVDRNIAIGVPISGLVQKIEVKVGEKVKKGQLLFAIDDRDLRARLGVEKSNVEVAKASLDRLKDQLGRLEAIQDRRAISVDEIKTKQKDVAVADAQLLAARAQVEETLRLIERLNVRAPRNGTILQNSIRVGEYISTSSSTAAMLLGDLEKLQVRADIDEQNAAIYLPGADAVAFPRNNTTLSIPLEFSYVEPYVIPKRSLTGGTNERVDTRVLQVIYTFKQPDHFRLYVGQQVDVFINLPAGSR